MPDSEPVTRLIYRSRSTIDPERREEVLADILDVARARNQEMGVTGALLITDHWFVQALEGAESAVGGLFERIRADDRHAEVTVLENDVADGRVFGRWAMARVSPMGRSDIPLTDVDGRIAPADHGDDTDRDQDALLTRMRNTIGADTV